MKNDLKSNLRGRLSPELITYVPSSFDVLGSDGETGGSSTDYVAYVFAHDDQSFGENGDEAIIKCGSFTEGTDVSVDLGFEPQWLMYKCSSSSDNWYIIDSMRGVKVGIQGRSTNGYSDYLFPNATNAEGTSGGLFFRELTVPRSSA